MPYLVITTTNIFSCIDSIKITSRMLLSLGCKLSRYSCLDLISLATKSLLLSLASYFSDNLKKKRIKGKHRWHSIPGSMQYRQERKSIIIWRCPSHTSLSKTLLPWYKHAVWPHLTLWGKLSILDRWTPAVHQQLNELEDTNGLILWFATYKTIKNELSHGLPYIHRL